MVQSSGQIEGKTKESCGTTTGGSRGREALRGCLRCLGKVAARGRRAKRGCLATATGMGGCRRHIQRKRRCRNGRGWFGSGGGPTTHGPPSGSGTFNVSYGWEKPRFGDRGKKQITSKKQWRQEPLPGEGHSCHSREPLLKHIAYGCLAHQLPQPWARGSAESLPWTSVGAVHNLQSGRMATTP